MEARKNPEAIKKSIENYFNELLKSKKILIKGLDDKEAYGHSAGTPLETWVKEELNDNGWKVYFPNKFLEEIFNKLKDIEKINKFIDSTWWGSLIFSKKHLEAFIAKEPILRWQQEGADIILFYGDDMIKDFNKVILINAKSHESSRKSRPPNIMSAQRLLEFFDNILEKDSRMLDLVEIWFFGVSYEATKDGGIIDDISIKNLVKLDVSKLPDINFDAGIQIQCHVNKMEEREQIRKKFVLDLSNKFIKLWEHHSERKQDKYKELTERIKLRFSQSHIAF